MSNRQGPKLGFRLGKNVLTTTPPPISRARKWAGQYIPTENRPLLDMSQGAPGAPPPAELRDSLAKTLADPLSFKYCAPDGDPLLKDNLAKEMKNIYGSNIDVEAGDIALSAGCNLAFIAVIMAIADAGDEVIVPTPWYFNNEMSLNLLGISTIPLETNVSSAFLPSIDSCRELITEKTRAIVLVTPNNPTGATYPEALLDDFLNLARDHNLALIVDETYRDFIPNGPPHRIFEKANWRDTFVHLFSFSKSYCIPGLRLGGIVCSPLLVEQVFTTLDCLDICAPRHIQRALGPVLPSLRQFIHESSVSLQHRHALFKQHIPSKWTVGSQGAYYAFVRHPYRGVSAEVVCRRLAMELGVATLPSSFFQPARGPDDPDGQSSKGDAYEWIRFSVANIDDEKVLRVCERLVECDALFPDSPSS